MIEITELLVKSVLDMKEKVEQFKRGELDPVRFKAFRVSMGVYEQRIKNTYMVRTRIPGGVVALEQLEVISAISKKYGNGKLHLTSRQDIQFQNVELDNITPIMEELLKVGISTRGTGGNTVRNVGCSPLSGVSVDEVFDVTPYVKKVTDYLIKDPTTMNLPRKFKIAFSNSPEDTANATIADIGFIAKIQDGKKGFEVYGGGGFGGSPRVALKLEEFIEDKEVLYYVQAMKEVFEKEGDRSNKHKARIRFIVHRLGEEKFIELFRNQLLEVKNRSNLDIEVEGNDITTGNNTNQLNVVDKNYKNILFAQKQPGYYSVYIHPQGGNLLAEDLDKVLDFVKGLDYEASFRTTSTQGFFVRDLKEEDALKLIKITEGFSSRFALDHSITCAGAATCQLGLCLSQHLLTGIKEAFKGASDDIKAALPKIFISGCPNSCGAHEKGLIGLSGRAKRTSDGLVPAYSVSFDGKVGANIAKMGDVYGDIPAKKIPKFLLDLAELKVKSEIEDFEEFLKVKDEDIKDLISKHAVIESFCVNPDLYYDFGSSEPFSLEGRGPGECSAGVFDVINLDLSNAESSLAQYKSQRKSSDLYNAAVSAARALLILKGIDTNKDREVFKGFTKNFIETGYVKRSITDLIDTLLDYKLGDVEDLSLIHI